MVVFLSTSYVDKINPGPVIKPIYTWRKLYHTKCGGDRKILSVWIIHSTLRKDLTFALWPQRIRSTHSNWIEMFSYEEFQRETTGLFDPIAPIWGRACYEIQANLYWSYPFDFIYQQRQKQFLWKMYLFTSPTAVRTSLHHSKDVCLLHLWSHIYCHIIYEVT